jgi:hypothetical protein
LNLKAENQIETQIRPHQMRSKQSENVALDLLSRLFGMKSFEKLMTYCQNWAFLSSLKGEIAHTLRGLLLLYNMEISLQYVARNSRKEDT